MGLTYKMTPEIIKYISDRYDAGYTPSSRGVYIWLEEGGFINTDISKLLFLLCIFWGLALAIILYGFWVSRHDK